MTSNRTNHAASVTARLLNRAKQTGSDFQTLLTAYCLERLLYRLGESTVRDRFVLKGAMLLRLWSELPYRATRDIDLLRCGDGSFEAISHDVRTICTTSVEPDAVELAADTTSIEVIRTGDELAGARVTLWAHCGSARLLLQIDLGLGDAVWPAPQSCIYPTLLDSPAPDVLAYPREAVVAEKLEAAVVLGDRNSRIKDFFDLHYLASRFEFDRAILGEAVRRTFAQRRTPIPKEEPIALTSAYWENPSRPVQVRAFARRAGLAASGLPSEELARLLGMFLLPILEDLRRHERKEGTWPAGGPWR